MHTTGNENYIIIRDGGTYRFLPSWAGKKTEHEDKELAARRGFAYERMRATLNSPLLGDAIIERKELRRTDGPAKLVSSPS
jgi:hypothetical protein